MLLPEDLAMPLPEPPPPTPSQPESSSNGQPKPNNEKERIHLRLRGAAPALMDLHKAFGTEPRKSDEPPADQNTIRFAYQAVASHLRPLIRDRCSYHIIDDAAAHELLGTLPPELKPSEGAELRLVDMRLTDGEYELQPHLQRWRDICEEAELWDDKTIISTVLRGGRYQVLALALAPTLALILTLAATVTLSQTYQVLGFRAILQPRGQSVDGGCLFRVLWQPEAPSRAQHPRLSLSLSLPSPLRRSTSRAHAQIGSQAQTLARRAASCSTPSPSLSTPAAEGRASARAWSTCSACSSKQRRCARATRRHGDPQP